MTEITTDSYPDLKRIADQWIRVFNTGPSSYLVTDPRQIRKTRNHPIVRFILHTCRLSGRERILEAGCGGGLYGLTLATFGCDCVELDFSEQMLKNVEITREEYQTEYGPLKVSTLRGDITDLRNLQGAFDVVFNEGVIEHWVDVLQRKQVLGEMVRAARPGGFVVVCIPNNSHPLYTWWYFLQRIFHTSWLIFRPGGELEEAIICASALEREMADVGLVEVVSEGFGVTRTISYYPRWLPLRAFSKLLGIILPPFPKHIRRRWGVYLLACGRRAVSDH